MDKRLVGKWYKEDMGETINIFDENPLRMKMSFRSFIFAPPERSILLPAALRQNCTF